MALRSAGDLGHGDGSASRRSRKLRQIGALRAVCFRLQALAVTRAHDGLPLDAPPFALAPGPAGEIAVGPRIGITRATDRPWRFGEAGSPFLSRRFG